MKRSETTCQHEILTTALADELIPLLLNHKDEVSLIDTPLDVDWPVYEALQNSGALRIYTARSEGVLIGYAIYIVSRHLHYNVVCADQDVLYIDPMFREGWAAFRLIRFSERQLKEAGAEIIMQHTKKEKDLTGLFTRLGYRHMDTLMYKRVEG